MSRLINEIELAGIARYFTTMQMFLSTLMLGGSGVTLPAPAALIAKQIAEAFASGDYAEAARMQGLYAEWPSRWMSYGLAAVMKASLNYIGVPSGIPFVPYKPIEGEALEDLHEHLKTIGFKKREM